MNPTSTSTTDIMILIGLGSVFLLIVFGTAKTSKIMETAPSPRTDAMGCQQAFKTIVAAGVLLGVLYALAYVLH